MHNFLKPPNNVLVASQNYHLMQPHELRTEFVYNCARYNWPLDMITSQYSIPEGCTLRFLSFVDISKTKFQNCLLFYIFKVRFQSWVMWALLKELQATRRGSRFTIRHIDAARLRQLTVAGRQFLTNQKPFPITPVSIEQGKSCCSF